MPVPPYEENERLLQLVREGNQEAQETLYEMNRGLVHMAAERFRSSAAYDYEELFQIGSIGLLRAIRRFNPDYQVKFSTYAVPMILGEIRRFLRDDGLIRVQRSIKEKHALIRRTEEELKRELQREPTVEQIAQASGLAGEDVVEVLEACQRPQSVEERIKYWDGAEGKRDNIGIMDWKQRENDRLFIEKLSLEEAMEHLPDRERLVLVHRFFKEETQSVIADKLGISQVQVSRIEKNALKHLKHRVEAVSS